MQRSATLLLTLFFAVGQPHDAEAKPFKKLEKFVNKAGKTAETLVRDTGKKIERSGRKIEKNINQIGKDSETVVRSVGQSLKPPLRTAGDIVSGGQTVRNREKAKANAEKEKAEIRNTQAKEMKKAAIQKTKENIANAKVDLEILVKELEALKHLQQIYEITGINIENLLNKMFEEIELLKLKEEGTTEQYEEMIENVDELLKLSLVHLDGFENQLEVGLQQKIIELYDVLDLHKNRVGDKKYWDVIDENEDRYNIFHADIDKTGEVVNLMKKSVDNIIELKNRKKNKLENYLELELSNLDKLREEN